MASLTPSYRAAPVLERNLPQVIRMLYVCVKLRLDYPVKLKENETDSLILC